MNFIRQIYLAMLHDMFRHPEAVVHVHVHTCTIMRRYMYLIVKRNAIMVCTFADELRTHSKSYTNHLI